MEEGQVSLLMVLAIVILAMGSEGVFEAELPAKLATLGLAMTGAVLFAYSISLADFLPIINGQQLTDSFIRPPIF